MAVRKLKSVTFASDPTWWKFSTLTAVPDELELSEEDGVVHIRIPEPQVQKDGSIKPLRADITRLRGRMGPHFGVGRWDVVVYDDAPHEAPQVTATKK